MNQQAARHNKVGVMRDRPSCDNMVTFLIISDHCFIVFSFFNLGRSKWESLSSALMPANVSATPPHAQFAKCNCFIHRIYSEILSHFKHKHNKVVQIIQIYFLLPIFFCNIFIIPANFISHCISHANIRNWNRKLIWSKISQIKLYFYRRNIRDMFLSTEIQSSRNILVSYNTIHNVVKKHENKNALFWRFLLSCLLFAYYFIYSVYR